MPKYGASKQIIEVISNEVKPKTKRRTFSAQEKLRIINEIDNCSHGEVGRFYAVRASIAEVLASGGES